MTMQWLKRGLTSDESKEAMGREPVVRTVINLWTILVAVAILTGLLMRYC